MVKSLGLLEIKGLASAITMSDVMAKVAAIEILEIERAKGFGWMTIKINGDVAAVQAAIDAGTAKAKEDNSFVSAKVIPRPDESIAKVFIKSTEKPKIQPTTPEKSAEVVETMQPEKVEETPPNKPTPNKPNNQRNRQKK